MIAVVAAGLVVLVAAAVVYAHRAGRVTHHRVSTGVALRSGTLSPSESRGMISFDVPPPAVADGPLSMHLERPAGRPPLAFPPGLTAAEATATLDAFTRQLATPPRHLERRPPVPSPAGRHRRDAPATPAPLTMTGFMRKLDADAIAADARMQHAVDVETGRIPRVRG